jgi:hypothetical protein
MWAKGSYTPLNMPISQHNKLFYLNFEQYIPSKQTEKTDKIIEENILHYNIEYWANNKNVRREDAYFLLR